MAENDNFTFLYTRHAIIRMGEHPISTEDVERILAAPDWTERHPGDDPGVIRAFGIPSTHPGTYYRIPHRFEGETRIVVISIHPDRTATPPDGAPDETDT